MSSAPWLHSLRSPEGLPALLQTRGPALAALLLALGVGGEAARLLTAYFGASDAPRIDAAAAGYTAPPGGTGPRTIDLLSLANAHLFGQATTAVSSGADAPQTRLPLVLAGVLAADDPLQGFAIVGETAAAAKLHAVGATLPGGARLHAVYWDRIVIDRGGNLESLALPKQMLAGMPPPPVAQVNGPAEIADRMRQAIQQNPSALSNVIRTQQVIAGGKQRGFRVYPGVNPSAFSRLGLRPGDLITAINDTPLDDPSRGEEVMRTLGSAPEVRVTVVRNGRQSDLVLDMAQVANEAQQIVGAPGATPAEPPPPSGEPAP